MAEVKKIKTAEEIDKMIEAEAPKKITREEKKAIRAAKKRAKAKAKKAAALSLTQAKAGYWFVLPWIIGVVFLFLIPVIQSLVYSFCEVSVKGGGGLKLEFVGIENYSYIFTKSEKFLPAVLDSLKDMAYQAPIIALFSMFIAQILNQKFVGRTAARIVFFLPVIIASGVLLEILSLIGMDTSVSLEGSSNIFTFQNESVLLKVMDQSGISPEITGYLKGLVGNIFDITWKSGIQIILYISGLQSIPKSYYEVSSMEGATAWEEFWKITFPLLSPTTLVCVVYTIIDSFTFYQNQVMRLIDENNMASGNSGIGSAMAWMYFLIIGIILVLVVKVIFAKTVYTEE